MKKISPVNIWNAGQLKEAVNLICYVISDNLKDSAIFYYNLQDAESLILAEGNLSMNDSIYQGWETNEYAWQWCANSLGLTIINE